MKIVRRVRDFDPILDGHVGFVPTMGAYHEGHLSLMRQARKECDFVVASLFVNPTQFGESEDFVSYPRDESRDFDLAEREGVDLMFAPSTEEMYPRKTTSIRVSGVSERWEGDFRPGHFEGVATVVCKLFHIVRPSTAYFGLKDLQQCAVVRTMVEDLNMPIELRFIETVREPDGLAMSSRNVRLSQDERAVAPMLHQMLEAVAESARTPSEGSQNPTAIGEACARAMNDLSSAGFHVEYLAAVDPVSMNEIHEYAPGCRVMAAAQLGRTRLIDNVPVDAQCQPLR